jgi:hypothetical protein
VGYAHWDECDSCELNEEPNDCHDLQIWHGNNRFDDFRLSHLHENALHGCLVFHGSEGTDNDELFENTHATSVGCSDVSLHEDHHYEGDENVQCDDGEELHEHNDEGSRDYGE